MQAADQRLTVRADGGCSCGNLRWELGPEGALIITGVGSVETWRDAELGVVVLAARCYACGPVDLLPANSASGSDDSVSTL